FTSLTNIFRNRSLKTTLPGIRLLPALLCQTCRIYPSREIKWFTRRCGLKYWILTGSELTKYSWRRWNRLSAPSDDPRMPWRFGDHLLLDKLPGFEALFSYSKTFYWICWFYGILWVNIEALHIEWQ